MSKKSFKEWLHYFITLDLFLAGVFFIFVPIYPWWVFMILAAVFNYVLPGLFGIKRR